MVLWRISNHESLAGDGALRASGRWHTRGHRIVYCAETPAAAFLELLVHLEIEFRDLPTRYRLLKIVAPEGLPCEQISPEQLPRDWVQQPAMTRALGDDWLAQGLSPLLAVPSALVPETQNVLLNPDHPGARRVAIVRVTEHLVDPRLLG